MDKGPLCDSLIKWIQTFKVQAPNKTVSDLSDGVAMAQVLTQIDGEFFDPGWLAKIKADTSTNWRLKTSNLKKILQGILDYYQECLGQRITEFKMPDVNKIGELCDADELGRLLQLILGCAVNCTNKQSYITNIMEMEESVQHVVMNAIQELMNKEIPSTAPMNEQYSDMGDQLKRLMDDLQSAVEAREHVTQRCHELDLQVILLQDEKTNLMTENERLLERLNKAESLDDVSTPAGRKYQHLQHQLDQLQEEMYKLETARDEYRLKAEELDKEVMELQQKNDDLTRVAEEARLLKDEVDILRETSDKAAKYETALETYKKKLEDLGEMRRQVKLLEEKNTGYMQRNMELEEEIKKSGTIKTQVDIYKKQVQELHSKLLEETKKADKSEFECKKFQEKLAVLQREKEKLMTERDALMENNEELRCTQFNIGLSQAGSQGAMEGSDSVCSDSDMLEMIPPMIKEKLIRLQHENRQLKMEREGNQQEKSEVLQIMLDEARLRQSELETENRLANHRIMELESQLDDWQMSRNKASLQGESELKIKLNSALSKIKDLELELQSKTSHVEEMENLQATTTHKMQLLQDSLNKKEDEMQAMEERYKKHLDKAKSVIKILDPKQNPGASPEMSVLRNQLQEKDRLLENIERETEKSKALKEMEERLMTTAFYNLAMQLQQRVSEERLCTNYGSQHSFVARQRQANSRRLGVGISHSEFVDY